VRSLTAEDLAAVHARDREVFGADRGAVLRWAFAAAPDLARVGRMARTTAYCFGRHGDHSDHLGPVVAEDPSLARDLVSACFSRPRSRPLIVDARTDPAWLTVLAELGFREQRPFTRMYLSDLRLSPARPSSVLSGPGSSGDPHSSENGKHESRSEAGGHGSSRSPGLRPPGPGTRRRRPVTAVLPAETEIVTVDVVVADRRGEPGRIPARRGITIREDGVAQRVRLRDRPPPAPPVAGRPAPAPRRRT
jgi:hypothetical protein